MAFSGVRRAAVAAARTWEDGVGVGLCTTVESRIGLRGGGAG